MSTDRVMHLRAISEFTKRGINFKTTKRGVTVLAKLKWNEDNEREDVVFSWAIQNPKDQYCKRDGIKEATQRMNSGLIVQTNYEERFPLKYQFFNAVSMTREFFHAPDNTRSDEEVRFIDLTFLALADIAESNEWYMDVSSEQLPMIHPDILINYIHRMNKSQIELQGITEVIGKSPRLTEIVNKTYGV